MKFKNNLVTSITLDELEKALKLTTNGKSPREDNNNSELYKYAAEEFKLRLLKFLNEIYTENCTQMNGEIPIFNKGDRRDLKIRGINILNTFYKIYSKILNMKLQSYSEEFMTETQNGFRKGSSCTDPILCLKLLIKKRR
jgi:hypothetical protein